ncbi:hypothetical protein FHG87_002743 [Trinorchestia longiramus]|nr:hypothetical protein FHG87_002743 [Trinorchestia longiramus]
MTRPRLLHPRQHQLPQLLVLLLLWRAGGAVAQVDAVPPALLEQALQEGFKAAQQQRSYEAILGLSIRGTEELDDASSKLFEFRRPEPDSKSQSVCLGASLLEVSKYLKERLPGTTEEAVRRVQSQTLRSGTCQRLLNEAGSDCDGVRVDPLPRCNPGNPYRTFDGTCNSVRNPLWGSSRRPFTRYIRPSYEDGLDEPRGSRRPPNSALPSPRQISVEFSQGFSGRPKPLLKITSLVMQFGQLLDHDLTHTPESAVRGNGNTLLPLGCCERGVPPSLEDQQRVPDCRPIDLSDDPFFANLGRSCMRFVRSLVADPGCKLGPREQLNQVTSFLDGSVLYGTSQFLSNHLRDPVNRGLLRTTRPPGSSPAHGTSCPGSFCNAALLPEQRCHAQTTQTCFISGDGRANEQPGLTSLHVLLMRVHNSVAEGLGTLNPTWGSDKVFQESRRIVVALLQQVVYREFLPVVLGSAPMDHFNLWLERDGYSGAYNESVDPTTPNVFATAAFRFGHSLVDDVLMQSPTSNITLLNSFFKPDILKQPGTRPSQFLQSLTVPSSQDPDEFMVSTLTNNLFGSQRFPIGLDLYALNVMRGRDHGIPPYNEWRSVCGLQRAASFNDLATILPLASVNKFRKLYKSVDDLDLFPAALAEPPLGNGILGPTFSCLIGQHFHDIKAGDRFWHENPRQPQPFSLAQLRELRSIWFSSLLCHHTNIAAMQPSPFLAPEPNRNPLTNCLSFKKLDLRPWQDGFVAIQDSPTERPAPIVPVSTQTPRPLVTQSFRPVTQRPSSTVGPIIQTTSPRPVSTVWTSLPATRPTPSPTRPTLPSRRPTFPSRRPTVSFTRPTPSPTRPLVSQTSSSVFPTWTQISASRPTASPSRQPVTPSWPLISSSRRPASPPEINVPPYRPTTQRPILQTQPSYYPQLPPFGRCRALGVWRTISGMDFWCTTNCYHPGSSHCPATHCSCS